MRLNKSSRRYAAAGLGLAHEEGVGGELLADMDALRTLVSQSPELARFLSDYSIARLERARALDALFRPRVRAFTWRLIRFLEARRRLGSLPEIAAAMREAEDRRAGIHKAEVISAYSLDDRLRRLLAGRIEAKTGGRAELTFLVQPSLIGGFSVQVGDLVYDLSVAGALRAANQRMRGA
jgi:F-type H+-transporting ATPase subunit delta